MIETLIVETLKQIEALSERVFPIFATKGTDFPFAVYISNGSTEDDSLDGWIGSYTTQMDIYVLHDSYEAMKYLSKDIIDALKEITEATVIISEDSPESFVADVEAYSKMIHLKIFH